MQMLQESFSQFDATTTVSPRGGQGVAHARHHDVSVGGVSLRAAEACRRWQGDHPAVADGEPLISNSPAANARIYATGTDCKYQCKCRFAEM